MSARRSAHRLWHVFALGAAIALAAPVGVGRVASPAEVKDRAEAIVRSYAERVALVVGPERYVPTVRILNTPALAYFDARARRITLPYWPTLDEQTKGFFLALLPDPEEAEELFGELFTWFLVAHEMTHWLQGELGIVLDRYEDERMANDVAVAFFMGEGDEARLVRLGELLDHALQSLPDPVPVGEDRAAYFNRRYADLAVDPAQYGQYQFTFILDAISRRADLLWEDMLRDHR